MRNLACLLAFWLASLMGAAGLFAAGQQSRAVLEFDAPGANGLDGPIDLAVLPEAGRWPGAASGALLAGMLRWRRRSAA